MPQVLHHCGSLHSPVGLSASGVGALRTLRLLVVLMPRWLLQAKDASQVAPELSAVVVYCQAVPFPGLAQALQHPRPCEMSSFSERKARRLIKEAGEGSEMGTGMGTGTWTEPHQDTGQGWTRWGCSGPCH